MFFNRISRLFRISQTSRTESSATSFRKSHSITILPIHAVATFSRPCFVSMHVGEMHTYGFFGGRGKEIHSLSLLQRYLICSSPLLSGEV